ncbi:spermidine synthase [Irpex lacteus]|nr:spermidine synthase [Irpex lacteus]
MAPLTHPSIRDGWFREVSSQWPGQAMSLKVERILHTERSKYQDVLVFRSTTYGNVLVLDGAIQCTERDEFSYQEMITHLPLASHPNPERVLVIGGGDGGVVREVLKHESVKKVVLVDIDEAVIRVSKQFLPHMSRLLGDPRVTVHIGDGFDYLTATAAAGEQALYDVIITDSSDPVGPAESLFQPPYFELLHNALGPGGTISTQGESQWLHLPLISNLLKTTRRVFAQSTYAFTTIPTYPSGQIGFIIASKDKDRNLAIPTRGVSGTRYYNEDVHRAAFVLPEFVRAQLEDGTDLHPQFSEVPPTTRWSFNYEGPKTILLLGSGFVAEPAAEYILRDKRNRLIVACRTLSTAQSLASKLDSPNVSAVSLDVSSHIALRATIESHQVDLVVSLVPYIYHADVVRAAVAVSNKRGSPVHVVTTSYVSPAMGALDQEAKEAGVIVMNEIGLDPGIDHLYAVKTISEVHEKGGKVKEFYSYCCGLPAPECSGNPLGYKFSWSSRGVLLSHLNDASYIENSQKVFIPGAELMKHAKPCFISPAFAFVAYPNRDSTPFREYYKINGEGEGEVVVRSTLRYQGFPEFFAVLVQLGWLDDSEKEWLKKRRVWTWREISKKMLDAADVDESTLVASVISRVEFSSESEKARILSGLKWIGLFSTDRIEIKRNNLFDTLCAHLEQLMKYKEGERDLILLQHKFIVEWKDGSTNTITSTLEAYGSPYGESAMAKHVGIPCGIAVQLVLSGIINAPGILAPYTPEICNPLREILESEGLGLVERIL